MLVPSGTFILSIPLHEGLKYKKNNPSGHTREYTKNLIFTELSLMKFKIEDHEELFAFKTMYNFKKLLQRYFLRNRWKSNDLVIKAIKQ